MANSEERNDNALLGRHAERSEASRGECRIMEKENNKWGRTNREIPIGVSNVIATTLIAFCVPTIIASLPEVRMTVLDLYTHPGRFTTSQLLWRSLFLSPPWIGLAAGFVIHRRPRFLVKALMLLTFVTVANSTMTIWLNVSHMASKTFPWITPLELVMLVGQLALPTTVIAVLIALVGARGDRIASNRVPTCVCGYLMRGLNEPRCPECGRVYTLDEFHTL